MHGPQGHFAKRNKSEQDKYCMTSLTCGILKKKKNHTHTYTRTAHRYREQTGGSPSQGVEE